MRISVVIPAYNEEKRIASCLKSVLNQTKKPIEIIVVDNSSSDKTAQIAKKMGVKVVVEKKQGITFARNKGFNTALGDIIARTDADTVVPKDWIEKIEEHFKKDKGLVAISGPAAFGVNISTPFVKAIVFRTNKRIFGHYGLFGPNLAIKRSAWIKIEKDICLDDSKVHEDLDLAIHIGKLGKIGYAESIKVRTSARRLRSNPSSLLVDYMIKWVDTIAMHKKYRIFRNGFSSRMNRRLL